MSGTERVTQKEHKKYDLEMVN